MPKIILFELGPTRSARVRWALLEAGLPFESLGNSPDIIRSDALLAVHPLGKLPAVQIDGKPLFESAAIVAAIADLVPEKNLIATPGTWARALHDQWVLFALTELEAHVQCAEINQIDFVLPASERVPAIAEQSEMLFKRAAAALDQHLAKHDFLVEDSFSAADIVVGYTINWGDEEGWLQHLPNLRAYQERLFARPHCTLVRHG